MRFTDLLAASLASLRQRLFRTSLTVLGVVIGTIAVVVMVSLGIGLTEANQSQTSNLTLRTVTVYAVPQQSEPGAPPRRMDDALVEELAALDGVETVIPVYYVEAIIKAGPYSSWASLQAVPREAIEQLGFDHRWGGTPEPGPMLQLLIGSQLAQQFYDEATGETADIDFESALLFLELAPEFDEQTGMPLPGKAAERMMVQASGQIDEPEGVWSTYSMAVLADLDDTVRALAKAMPGEKLPNQTTATAAPGRGNFTYSQFTIIANDIDAAERIHSELREAGFESSAEIEWIKQSQGQAAMVQAVLGGIGAISLLVAAIGIANTMLMSVYERTKEIGIMKVLGAAMGDIRKLFLIESATIGFVGGTLGVLLGYAASAVINAVAQGRLTEGMGSISVIPLPLALAAIAGATLIGTVAGLAPAQRAMKLSPLAAIRSE